MKISAVSYLNTKPFLHGLRKSADNDLEISVDIPSECARKVIEGEVDLGLIPVAVIPLLKMRISFPVIASAPTGR